MNKTKTRMVCQFAVPADKNGKAVLCLGDPCYRHTTVELEVRPGRWQALVDLSDEGDWGWRVAELVVYHAEPVTQLAGLEWKPHPTMVGVDSGQVAITHQAAWSNQVLAKKETIRQAFAQAIAKDDGAWYGLCCDRSCDDNKGVSNAIPGGVVSSSGYGDGAYDCRFARRDGEVVAVKVVFLEDEAEDDQVDDEPEEQEES